MKQRPLFDIVLRCEDTKIQHVLGALDQYVSLVSIGPASSQTVPTATRTRKSHKRGTRPRCTDIIHELLKDGKPHKREELEAAMVANGMAAKSYSPAASLLIKSKTIKRTDGGNYVIAKGAK